MPNNSLPHPESESQVRNPPELHFTYIGEYCEFITQHIDEILDRDETGDQIAGFVVRVASLINDIDVRFGNGLLVESVERYIEAHHPELPYVQGGVE